MITVEERLRDALTARADLVTVPPVLDPAGRDLPARRRRLAPVLAAAAVALVVAAVLVVLRVAGHTTATPPADAPASFFLTASSGGTPAAMPITVRDARTGAWTGSVRTPKDTTSVGLMATADPSQFLVVLFDIHRQARLDRLSLDSAGRVASLRPDHSALARRAGELTPSPDGTMGLGSPRTLQEQLRSFVPDGGLDVVDLRTGRTRFLAAPSPDTSVYDASWSPSGKTLTFLLVSSGGHDGVWVRDVSTAGNLLAGAREVLPYPGNQPDTPHARLGADGSVVYLDTHTIAKGGALRQITAVDVATGRRRVIYQEPTSVEMEQAGLPFALDPTGRALLVFGAGSRATQIDLATGQTTRLATPVDAYGELAW